ncbi:MAG: DUF2442 domain-containing protein [Thermodesulfobacteriota bacterium]
MNLSALGARTFQVEVTHISSHGVWLLGGGGRELFMAYDTFPWFRNAPVAKILNVEELTPGHYYWPELDVDLTEEIIVHPERFPLQAKFTHPVG